MIAAALQLIRQVLQPKLKVTVTPTAAKEGSLKLQSASFGHASHSGTITEFLKDNRSGKDEEVREYYASLEDISNITGYAPYDDPQIAIAVCIPNGYSSNYAALVASQVMQYYFDPDSLSGILSSEDIPKAQASLLIRIAEEIRTDLES